MRGGVTFLNLFGPLYMSQIFFNPFLANGLSHNHHLDDSTVILGDFRCDFEF